MNYTTLKYTGFHLINHSIRPVKLLNNKEKEEILKINNNPHTICITDMIPIELGAKVGDIIAIKNLKNEVYRIVINKQF